MFFGRINGNWYMWAQAPTSYTLRMRTYLIEPSFLAWTFFFMWMKPLESVSNKIIMWIFINSKLEVIHRMHFTTCNRTSWFQVWHGTNRFCRVAFILFNGFGCLLLCNISFIMADRSDKELLFMSHSIRKTRSTSLKAAQNSFLHPTF